MRRGAVRGRAQTRFRVTVSDARGRAATAPGLARFLERIAPRTARGTATVALVGDAVSRRLNRQYRGVDRATDVLSFEAGDDRRSTPAGHEPHLGDVVIARGVAARQARAHGHAPAVEWRILALHGLLHLLGYDHDGDEGQMRRVEERLRRRAGLPTGLTARAGGTRAR